MHTLPLISSHDAANPRHDHTHPTTRLKPDTGHTNIHSTTSDIPKLPNADTNPAHTTTPSLPNHVFHSFTHHDHKAASHSFAAAGKTHVINRKETTHQHSLINQRGKKHNSKGLMQAPTHYNAVINVRDRILTT